MTGLESVGAALGIVKTISGIAKDVNSIELTRQIIDLQGKLLDVQRTMAELQDRNVGLKEQLRQATERKDMESRLSVEYHAYWLDKDGTKDGPFCTVCWDNNKKLVRLLPDSVMGVPNGYTCPVDKTQFLEVPNGPEDAGGQGV